MSDDSRMIQWSISLPPAAQYAKGDMLNIKGETVREVQAMFDDILEGKFIETATDVANLLRAAAVVTQEFAGANTPDAHREYQNDYRGAEEEDRASRDRHGGDRDSGPQGGDGYYCNHGKREFRSGNKNGKSWQGYFCPLPKGDRNQCDVVWA